MKKILEHDWFDQPLPENIRIGERSWLYSSYAFIHYQSKRPRGLIIGNDSGLYNGTFFDLGPQGEVEIGNFCTLVGVIISSNQKIKIGDYSFLAHEVVIADSCAAVPGDRNGGNQGRDIVIEENAWIGSRAVLLSGAHIGEGAIVGAAAVVDFEVPPYTVAAGNPARIIKHIKN